MTNFFLGGASSNRDILFTDTIEAAVNNGKRVIVIIPDQFSFEYDKKLYNKLGAVGFNKITTLGFNRLAEVLENNSFRPSMSPTRIRFSIVSSNSPVVCASTNSLYEVVISLFS